MASQISYSIFCEAGDPAKISIYESDGATQDKLCTRVFTENSLFQQHIDTISRPHLRIVSIHSKSALSPLQISRDALEILQDQYNLGPELWDLTVTFGNKPLIAAAGEGVMRLKDGDNGIRDISHRFTFPVTGGPGRWTIRQIGIFHRYDPKSLQNLWIFLHANPNTAVQKELETFASKPYKSSVTDSTWFALHQAVLTPCLNGWRSYVNHLGNEVDRHFDKALTFVYESMNNNGMADGDGNLADIHNTRNRLLDIPSRLMTTLETLQRLHDLSLDLGSQHKAKDNGFKKLAKSAAYYKEHLEALVKGVEIMKEKVADMLKMIEIGLSFRMTSKMLNLNMSMVDLNNRMLSANQQLLTLGTKSFDDNATVKVVTIVTLIYLPASLVSSILGMNLFKFDDGTNEEFTISKQFWIFVVATIVLAAITLSGWLIWTHKEEVKRRKPLASQDSPRGTGQDLEGKES